MKFMADIGTWERFREVDLEANTPRQAFSMLAAQHGPEKIVQIFINLPNGGHKCVYDYLNGFAPYNKDSQYAQLPVMCPECKTESEICPNCGYKLYCPECDICGGCAEWKGYRS